jgi:RNAse (barnase) inhibitor barstar
MPLYKYIVAFWNAPERVDLKRLFDDQFQLRQYYPMVTDPVWWCLMEFVQTWIPRNFKCLKPQNKIDFAIGGVNAAFLH